MDLHRGAGNRAVAGLLLSRPARGVQRAVGWTDASKEGYAWNADERVWGKIRRIPLEGLAEGLQQESAWKWVWDDKKAGKGHFEKESTMIKALSPESAKGKAIVLVPEALDATKTIEVVVLLHGYTEYTGRPFAGWRALTKPAPGKDPLRQGIDAKDVAPVRDVALDQAEQQLEESGQTQLVIVLPQGGLHSQFGKAGYSTFDSGKYVDGIVSRLLAESRWKDANGKVVGKAPNVGRVSMAGHSGAGATLKDMAEESVRAASQAGKPGASSTLTGDLVLFDAINGPGERRAFREWAEMRLNQDLAVIKDTAKSDADKLAYLRTAPKLLGYYSSLYKTEYEKLDKAIGKWFTDHASELGSFAGRLRANFAIVPVALGHEEVMRGVQAGKVRSAGSGGILKALKALKPP